MIPVLVLISTPLFFFPACIIEHNCQLWPKNITATNSLAVLWIALNVKISHTHKKKVTLVYFHHRVSIPFEVNHLKMFVHVLHTPALCVSNLHTSMCYGIYQLAMFHPIKLLSKCIIRCAGAKLLLFCVAQTNMQVLIKVA